jgi:hypothetical protein
VSPLPSIAPGDDVVAIDVPDGWVVDATEVTDGNLSQRFRDPTRDADGGVAVGFGNVDSMAPSGEQRLVNGVEWIVTIVNDRARYIAVFDDAFVMVVGTGFDPDQLDQFVASLRAVPGPGAAQ